MSADPLFVGDVCQVCQRQIAQRKRRGHAFMHERRGEAGIHYFTDRTEYTRTPTKETRGGQMIVVGIDPGLTGAIARLDHRGAYGSLMDMPTMQRADGQGAVKNQVNGVALANILHEMLDPYDKNEVYVFIEQAQSMPAVIKGRVVQGGASIFSTGHTAGMVEGVVAALRYPHRLVRPAQWKHAFKLAKDKEKARAAAQRLFPEASLDRKKDHNRAEALLIAKFGHTEVA